jgi:hypothetical protein
VNLRDLQRTTFEPCGRCENNPVAQTTFGEAMLFCQDCLASYELWFDSTTQRGIDGMVHVKCVSIAAALRKRAEYLSPYDNDRRELLRAADLIEKEELP